MVGDGGETKKNYKVIIICAYILAILVIVGLIILLIVFVVRYVKCADIIMVPFMTINKRFCKWLSAAH